MSNVSITGLNKADVLAALYNAARPQGLGFLSYDPQPMTSSEAKRILDSGQTYFDYLRGRVMKVNLASDVEFGSGLYDRDNGQGTAEAVIAALRKSKAPDNPETAGIHRQGIANAAEIAIEMMNIETVHHEHNVTLGLADAKQILAPKIAAAVKPIS